MWTDNNCISYVLRLVKDKHYLPCRLTHSYKELISQIQWEKTGSLAALSLSSRSTALSLLFSCSGLWRSCCAPQRSLTTVSSVASVWRRQRWQCPLRYPADTKPPRRPAVHLDVWEAGSWPKFQKTSCLGPWRSSPPAPGSPGPRSFWGHGGHSCYPPGICEESRQWKGTNNDSQKSYVHRMKNHLTRFKSIIAHRMLKLLPGDFLSNGVLPALLYPGSQAAEAGGAGDIINE